MSTEFDRNFLVINRSLTEPVCCIRWRGSPQSLLEALDEPWRHWPPKIQLMLGHYSNLPRTLSMTSLRTYEPFTLAEFDSLETYRQGKEKIERGDPLGTMQGLVKQPDDLKNAARADRRNGRHANLTEAEIRAIKADQSEGMSHKDVSAKHDISDSLSKAIKTNRRHAEVARNRGA